MFFFRAARFGRMGPLGLAFTGYQLWRRLSPAQKAAMRSKTQDLVGNLRGRSDASDVRMSPPSTPTPAAAPARPEEIAPTDLTSPGTVADPELEQRRAEQALDRELESRASKETKFEELRRKQEDERHDLATKIDEPPA